MSVFICWSGDRSHALAKRFETLLQAVWSVEHERDKLRVHAEAHPGHRLRALLGNRCYARHLARGLRNVLSAVRAALRPSQ